MTTFQVECREHIKAPRRRANVPGPAQEGLSPMQSQPIPDGLCQCGCGRPTGVAPLNDASKGWRRGVPLRYVVGHSARHAPHDYLEEDTGYLTPCWVWQRFKDRGGYGRKWMGVGRPNARAHRVYYELYVGPVPEGLQIDHLCRVRACVNPEHMEPVTFAENQRRGLHGILAPGYCKRGHPFNAENTRVDSRGRRKCRTCDTNRQREARVPGPGTGARQLEKTHCPQGHPYDEANTYRPPRGERQCRICKRETKRRLAA